MLSIYHSHDDNDILIINNKPETSYMKLNAYTLSLVSNPTYCPITSRSSDHIYNAFAESIGDCRFRIVGAAYHL
jgi:hypothetical protein